MQKSRNILKQFWGFDQFRPFQEEIVDFAIYGKDVLALLPTGGGKSVCFQVPGLALNGLTIVISPLIALMEDQVNELKRKGIPAKAITSAMSYREIDIALDNARFGGLKFLYVSPERIHTRIFQERFKLMDIGLLVVDEAHCISEWGHDFRPSYKTISHLREIHPNVPMIALTATANEHVKAEICDLLKLRKPEIIEAPFNRPNIRYDVVLTENKRKDILNFIQSKPDETGIVYCQTRRSVKEITKMLFDEGVSVQLYHGGLTHAERTLSLQSWLSEKTKVMVATNAFGMGIDKGNVRYVLHAELPDSPEAYFQEAGRAGRDGLNSNTFIFFEHRDVSILKERVESQFPEINEIKRVYRSMCSYLQLAVGSGNNETYELNIVEMARRFSLQIPSVFTALRILEMNGDIRFSTDLMKGSRVKIAIDNVHLYRFQLSNPTIDPLTTFICRLYSTIFEEFNEIDEDLIKQKLKLTTETLHQQLRFLEMSGVIDINWRSSLPQVTFLHERFADDYLSLKPEVYRLRKERALYRMETMLEYLDTESCKEAFILSYFGQKGRKCGKCSSCLKNSISIKEIETLILVHLEKEMSISELLQNFDPTIHELVKGRLKELLSEEKIILVGENRLKKK